MLRLLVTGTLCCAAGVLLLSFKFGYVKAKNVQPTQNDIYLGISAIVFGMAMIGVAVGLIPN